MGMGLESASYFVMRHYSLSLRDLDEMSPEGFTRMFTWAAAVSKFEADQQQKKMEESNSKQRVANTDGSRPMPGSEGW